MFTDADPPPDEDNEDEGLSYQGDSMGDKCAVCLNATGKRTNCCKEGFVCDTCRGKITKCPFCRKKWPGAPPANAGPLSQAGSGDSRTSFQPHEIRTEVDRMMAELAAMEAENARVRPTPATAVATLSDEQLRARVDREVAGIRSREAVRPTIIQPTIIQASPAEIARLADERVKEREAQLVKEHKRREAEREANVAKLLRERDAARQRKEEALNRRLQEEKDKNTNLVNQAREEIGVLRAALESAKPDDASQMQARLRRLETEKEAAQAQLQELSQKTGETFQAQTQQVSELRAAAATEMKRARELAETLRRHIDTEMSKIPPGTLALAKLHVRDEKELDPSDPKYLPRVLRVARQIHAQQTRNEEHQNRQLVRRRHHRVERPGDPTLPIDADATSISSSSSSASTTSEDRRNLESEGWFPVETKWATRHRK